jgi:secreted PhoX family phosphatase
MREHPDIREYLGTHSKPDMVAQTKIDRRTFMRRGAMGAGALWAVSLAPFMARRAYAEAPIPGPYGTPSPKIDGTTGLPLLQLPDGFEYWSFSWTGDRLADGTLCPDLHDGMAVIGTMGPDRLILCRNHETGNGLPFVNRPPITYANDGAGGTTNLTFNLHTGRWEKAWPTVAGTIRNCAGGVSPWGTWITCEENLTPGHGWNFDVGPHSGDPRPLTAMGRFSHEALMVDPATGYVYETEDDGNSGVYRFVPNVYGQLIEGGDLFMLKVAGANNVNLSAAYPIGTTWDVEWVRIADPFAVNQRTYAQGAAQGGARFSRLEGAWWGVDTGFVLTTNGGVVGEGQIFEYNPEAETLKLIYDAPTAQELDNPDNITVSPRGGLLLCEDAAGGQNLPAERLVGLTLDGNTFTFGVNNVILPSAYNERVPAGNYTGSEWAGACYSPDGRWLFVNIQTPGITFAIRGPWGAGPL